MRKVTYKCDVCKVDLTTGSPSMDGSLKIGYSIHIASAHLELEPPDHNYSIHKELCIDCHDKIMNFIKGISDGIKN